MTDKKEKRDGTPTHMKHSNGAFVTVPAYKVEQLTRAGTFTKVAAKKAPAGD